MLPDLVVQELLVHLPFPDVVSYRLVNLKWNHLCCKHLKTKVSPVTLQNEQDLFLFTHLIAQPNTFAYPLVKFRFKLNPISEQGFQQFFNIPANHMATEIWIDSFQLQDEPPIFPRQKYMIENFSQLRFLSLTIHDPCDFDETKLNFRSLTQLSVYFEKDTEVIKANPDEKLFNLRKLVDAAPILERLMINVGSEDYFPEPTTFKLSESILNKLPGFLSELPNHLKIGLSMTRSYMNWEAQCDWDNLLRNIFDQLVKIDWIGYSFHIQIQTQAVDVTAELLRIQRQYIEEVSIRFVDELLGNTTFSKCRSLYLSTTYRRLEDFMRTIPLFPNLRTLRFRPPIKHHLEIMNLLASHLPNLYELEILGVVPLSKSHFTTTKLSQIRSIFTAEITGDMSSCEKLETESNPLGNMKKLRILKIHHADDTVVDWLMYISAGGKINRLELLRLKVRPRCEALKRYPEFLKRYHQTVQLNYETLYK